MPIALCIVHGRLLVKSKKNRRYDSAVTALWTMTAWSCTSGIETIHAVQCTWRKKTLMDQV